MKPACLARLVNGAALAEQRFGQSDPFGGNVFIYCGSGRRLEDPADIRTAQIKVRRQRVQLQVILNVCIDIRKNIINLRVICGGVLVLAGLCAPAALVKRAV